MTAEEKLEALRAAYPVCREQIPDFEIEDRKYRVRFADSPGQLEAIQQLRFQVFNVELGEGLVESFETGRDEDRFDPVCHHLIVTERSTGEVIGTYRMQTSSMAGRYEGFYSAGEFDLQTFPAEVLDNAVEVGRACIDERHRNRRTLFLLWKGLAAYLAQNRKKYLFGCCSLTSQDPSEGKRVMEYLKARGEVRADVHVPPQPGWECYGENQAYDARAEVELPRLFSLYLRYGAKVCGPPALDRYFKTIDYLVLLNVAELDSDLYRLYFD